METAEEELEGEATEEEMGGEPTQEDDEASTCNDEHDADPGYNNVEGDDNPGYNNDGAGNEYANDDGAADNSDNPLRRKKKTVTKRAWNLSSYHQKSPTTPRSSSLLKLPDNLSPFNVMFRGLSTKLPSQG